MRLLCNKKEVSFSKKMLNSIIVKNMFFLFVVLLVSVLSACLSALSPIIYQKVIDEIIPNRNAKMLFVAVIIISAIPILIVILDIVRKKISFVFSQRCSMEFSKFFFIKLINSKYCDFCKYDSVRLSALFTRDADYVSAVYLQSIISVVESSVKLVLAFIIVANYSIVIAVSSLVAVPLFFIMINSQKKTLSSVSNTAMNAYTSFEKSIIETFNGIKTVKSYNAEEYETKKFVDELKKRFEAEWNFRRLQNIVNNILPTGISQFAFGCIFSGCAFLSMEGKLSFGALVAIVAYVPTLIASLKNMTGIKIGSSIVYKKLLEYDNIAKLSEDKNSSIYPKLDSESIMNFKNVDFSYDRDNFKLHIDELKIEKGDFVTIVGTSGGGKSSLFDIFNKFFSILSGKATFMGVNIEELDTKSMRELFSTVHQDLFMFNDSIASNISYPEPPNKEKLAKVIKEAQLTNFINSLPNKENTLISDFGENLSGGERQRISLARALYRNSQIMLLDEPTAALDADTSLKVFELLKNENSINGKTIVVITHDINKSFFSNKVIVVENGKIVEQGSPKELLATDSLFKFLFTSQNKKNKS